VPELAIVAGVSQRVLELAFNQALGITPLRYMRWQRMNQAYQELYTSDPTFSQVTKVALGLGLGLGFNDLGRFATDYKRLFQEYPLPRPLRVNVPGASRAWQMRCALERAVEPYSATSLILACQLQSNV